MPKRPRDTPEPIQVPDEEKLAILNRHCVTAPGWKSLDETQWCLHCAKTFTGRSVRVYRDPGFRDGYSLECGTPGCNGSPIDWHEPESDFSVGVTAQYAAADRADAPRGHAPEDAEPVDPAYEECGDYGAEVSLTPEYRDEAQRQKFRPVLWQEGSGPGKQTRVHPELVDMLRTAAKEAYRQVFTEHFGAQWMDQWKIVFRARVDGWVGDADVDELIQVEVESASEIDVDWPEELFQAVCDLTEDEDTEAALLEELQSAFVTYLNLYAPELMPAGKHLEMKMEVTGYGG